MNGKEEFYEEQAGYEVVALCSILYSSRLTEFRGHQVAANVMTPSENKRT
jgi:hypothetical protein